MNVTYKKKKKKKSPAQVKLENEIKVEMSKEQAGAPDWSKRCTVCNSTPVVRNVNLCGPCCFGEAETAGGNW